jgi:hypothetical protein
MLSNIRGSIALLGGALVYASVSAVAAPGFRNAASGAGVSGNPGIALQVTVGTDLASGACATASTLDVLIGDRINFCYRVSNTTAVPLAYESLDDSVEGMLLSEHSLVIAPGATLQYNRIKEVAASEAGTHTSTWTARDLRPDYAPSTRAGAFIDLASRPSATDLSPPGDAGDATGAGMVAVDVPFSFSFYGDPASQLCVGTDGVALVGLDSCILFPSPNGIGPLPQPGMGTAILPLWDDFAGKSGCSSDCINQWGAVYADTLGTAPNRQFVIEWYNLRHEQGAANTDRATFELIIDEASGRLSFEYGDVDYTAYGNYFGAPDVCTHGDCASIGLQQDDTWATSFAYLAQAVTSGSAVDWIPNAPATYSAQANVTLTIGKPVAAVPATMAASAAPGAQTTLNLTLANSGNRDLHWTLDQGKAAIARPPAGAVVPAYVTRILLADFPTLSNTLLAFDAANPPDNAAVGPVERIYDSAAFVDDDFSRQYGISGWHHRGATTIFTTEYLETVDTTTAEVTTIGNTGIGPFESIQGLAWDPLTSTLYATIPALDGSGTTLANVDRYTGAVTRLFQVSGIELATLVGLAIDGDGRMFSIEQNSNSLVEIDKTTGTLRLVGPLGDESLLLLSGALAFDRASGALYMTGATADVLGGLYSVDKGTGHASLVDTIGSEPQLASALAIATAGGPCVNATPAPWLSFAASAGTVAPGTSQAISVTLDATTLTDGRYEANLCLRSNDPYRHTAPVHVTFQVGNGTDLVFRDGFDGS